MHINLGQNIQDENMQQHSEVPEGGAASASRTNAQTPGAGITDLVIKQS